MYVAELWTVSRGEGLRNLSRETQSWWKPFFDLHAFPFIRSAREGAFFLSALKFREEHQRAAASE